MKILFGLVLALALMTAGISAASMSSSDLSQPRIVGGRSTKIEKYPYQVSLRYKSPYFQSFGFRHDCGGSIYSDRLIITAAHCVNRRQPKQFLIVAGSSYREGNDGFISPVVEIIQHEHFDPDTFVNDVAIMVLGASLPLNNFTMKPIELSKDEWDTKVGQMASVTGWGRLRVDGDLPAELQVVNVPIVSNEDCDKDYEPVIRIREMMICAGYRGVGKKDACNGDSGGPLTVDGKLSGIVSFGEGCADPDHPGVYAKVSYLLPWIMDKITKINERLK